MIIRRWNCLYLMWFSGSGDNCRGDALDAPTGSKTLRRAEARVRGGRENDRVARAVDRRQGRDAVRRVGDQWSASLREPDSVVSTPRPGASEDVRRLRAAGRHSGDRQPVRSAARPERVARRGQLQPGGQLPPERQQRGGRKAPETPDFVRCRQTNVHRRVARAASALPFPRRHVATLRDRRTPRLPAPLRTLRHKRRHSSATALQTTLQTAQKLTLKLKAHVYSSELYSVYCILTLAHALTISSRSNRMYCTRFYLNEWLRTCLYDQVT